MAVSVRTRTTQSANGAGPLRLGPAPRQRNVPWMVTGVLLVVGGALLFAVIATRLAHRQPVIALARAVPAGQVITAGDLKVVHLSVDAELRGISAGDVDDVLGRPAATDLAAATLLTRDDVGVGTGLSRGKAVVGLGLKPGQLPSQDLGPGARVVVLDTGESAGGGTSEPRVLAAGRVTSVHVVDSGAGAGTVAVSVVVAEAGAPAVAAANAAGRAALGLVSQ
jgi:hypothetical protein